jgi:ribosomal protein L18
MTTAAAATTTAAAADATAMTTTTDAAAAYSVYLVPSRAAAPVATLAPQPTASVASASAVREASSETSGEEVDLCAFLEGSKLMAHHDALREAGFTDAFRLDAAADDALARVGLKKPEVKRMRRYLAKFLHGIDA